MSADSRRLPEVGFSAALDASALPIPLIAASLVAASAALFGVPLEVPVVVLAAAGSFGVYLLDRAWPFSPEDAANRPARIAWHKRHPWYRFPALATAIGACVWALSQLPSGAWILAAVLGLLALLHGVPVAGARMKASAWLKPLLVAAAWSVGAVLLPLLAAADNRPGLAAAAVALVIMRALTVAANVLLTDIADAEGDVSAGLDSLAGRLGEPATRKLSMYLLLAAALTALAQFLRSGDVLWSVEASGLVLYAAAAAPGKRTLPAPLYLDLLVAFPAVTWLVSLF